MRLKIGKRFEETINSSWRETTKPTREIFLFFFFLLRGALVISFDVNVQLSQQPFEETVQLARIPSGILFFAIFASFIHPAVYMVSPSLGFLILARLE